MRNHVVPFVFAFVAIFCSAAYAGIPPVSGVAPVRNCPGLSNQFLENFKEQSIPVSIFLVNGIKLQGHIADYDCEVIILDNSVSQMVYKHAVGTIVPATPE